MDEETKKLLIESLELAKENNEMLKKLAAAQKRAIIYRIVYWSIIILSTFGAFFFIQPFLGNIFNVYTGGVSGGSNVGDVLKNLNNKSELQQIQDLIK